MVYFTHSTHWTEGWVGPSARNWGPEDDKQTILLGKYGPMPIREMHNSKDNLATT